MHISVATDVTILREAKRKKPSKEKIYDLIGFSIVAGICKERQNVNMDKENAARVFPTRTLRESFADKPLSPDGNCALRSAGGLP